MVYTHKIGQAVKLGLSHRAVVDYHSVLEVAALDEVGFDKRLDLAHEHECAAAGNLLVKRFHALERSKLVGEYWRIELHHHVNAEIIVGKHYD